MNKKLLFFVILLHVFISITGVDSPKIGMRVMFSRESNFGKFIILSKENKGNKEIYTDKYFQMIFECKIIRNNDDSIVLFNIEKEIIDKIKEDTKNSENLCFNNYKKIINYVFFKVSSSGENKLEEEKDININKDISRFEILINIPDNLYPTSIKDLISYLSEKNETSDYVFDIQDFLNNEKDNLKFAMDENGLIWTYKKCANNKSVIK